MKGIDRIFCENCRVPRHTRTARLTSPRHGHHAWEPLRVESDPLLGPSEREFWGTHLVGPSGHPVVGDETVAEPELEKELVAI
jgi:hypothetical protein